MLISFTSLISVANSVAEVGRVVVGVIKGEKQGDKAIRRNLLLNGESMRPLGVSSVLSLDSYLGKAPS